MSVSLLVDVPLFSKGCSNRSDSLTSMFLFESSVFDLDLSTRLGLSFFAQTLVFVWIYYIVAPLKAGWSRLTASAFVLPALTAIPFLFRHDADVAEFIMRCYSVHTFFWLTTSKLIAFCLNRGQLVKVTTQKIERRLHWLC